VDHIIRLKWNLLWTFIIDKSLSSILETVAAACSKQKNEQLCNISSVSQSSILAILALVLYHWGVYNSNIREQTFFGYCKIKLFLIFGNLYWSGSDTFSYHVKHSSPCSEEREGKCISKYIPLLFNHVKISFWYKPHTENLSK